MREPGVPDPGVPDPGVPDPGVPDAPGHAPLILLPARPAAAGRASRHAASFVVQPSIDALRRAGAEVWILPPAPYTAEEARSLIARSAGLCLQGGDDVHPRHYATAGDGEDGPGDSDGADRRDLQDRSEIALTLAAVAAGVPVLGLCRGAQLLNVALGGTLSPATAHAGVIHHPADAPGTVGALHDVSVHGGTRLHEIIGADHADVSSVHHQAIDRVADSLVVSAVAGDGLIEAIELDQLDGGWVVGVQWHPEDTAATDPAQQRLFDAFVRACKDV